MSTQSEGADGPVCRVALGLRFEFFADDDVFLGAIFREDVKGAGIPRAGEHLARGTFVLDVHKLTGISPVVHHIEHYLNVPGSKDWSPLCMVVSRVPDAERQPLLDARGALEDQGWSVLIADDNTSNRQAPQ